MTEQDDEDPMEAALRATIVKEWTAYGLLCRMRSGFGAINGYVQIPHALFTVESAERVLEVHYGITYGPDDDGWVGFDTVHAGDYWAPDDLAGLVPPQHMVIANSMRELSTNLSWGRRWTLERLQSETETLAQQVAVALDLATIDVEKGEGS